MDIRHLRTFLRVYSNRSISAAALEMAVSQPALSKVLRRLEGEFGVPLFNRLPRGLEPTEYGRALAEAARAIDTNYRLAMRQIDAMREHMTLLQAALPRVPGAVADAFSRVRAEMDNRGMRRIGLLVLAFAALGFGVERLFWYASTGARKRIIASRLETPAQRLRAMGARFVFGSSWVAAFALGTVGAFLAFDWPPALRDGVLRLLVVVVMVRLSLVFGRLLFAPGAERFRPLPLDTPAAWFWHRRLVLNLSWFSVVYGFVEWLSSSGVEPGVWRLVAYAMLLVQLALIMEMVWRRPGVRDEQYKLVGWSLSVAFVLLLMLRVVGAFPVFWLGALLLGAGLEGNGGELLAQVQQPGLHSSRGHQVNLVEHQHHALGGLLRQRQALHCR
jgi:DNA-binding transcriptional LysR family regulator